MIPLTFLYDDFIDRPKLSEKNPFEYIVPPPTSGVGTKISHRKVLATETGDSCLGFQNLISITGE